MHETTMHPLPPRPERTETFLSMFHRLLLRREKQNTLYLSIPLFKNWGLGSEISMVGGKSFHMEGWSGE